MKRIAGIIFVVVLLCGLFTDSAYAKEASGKKWRIALCNDYAGNSWRQQMLKDWAKAVAEAKEQGILEEGPAFTTNESSAAEQAAQIQNLILEGYDAIVLDAASPTALNGAVKNAIRAGIPVISFDNNITAPGSYNLIINYELISNIEMEYFASKLPGGGNCLEVRGLPGSGCDMQYHNGAVQGLEKFPQFKVVGVVYGRWTQSIAQKEVAGILPSLPEIDAVITQGGDGYGTVKAFQAAGRPLPIVFMGNRQDELALWKELHDQSGYNTGSSCSCPGSSQIALWTAIEILNGKEVPHQISLPPLTIPENRLNYFLEKTPKGGVATLDYPRSWVQELIANTKAGLPPPPDPLP